jgi:hypothetical protein
MRASGRGLSIVERMAIVSEGWKARLLRSSLEGPRRTLGLTA